MRSRARAIFIGCRAGACVINIEWPTNLLVGVIQNCLTLSFYSCFDHGAGSSFAPFEATV